METGSGSGDDDGGGGNDAATTTMMSTDMEGSGGSGGGMDDGHLPTYEEFRDDPNGTLERVGIAWEQLEEEVDCYEIALERVVFDDYDKSRKLKKYDGVFFFLITKLMSFTQLKA